MLKKNTVANILCCLIVCAGNTHLAQADGNVYRLPYSKSMYCSKDANGKEVCNFPKESPLEIAHCSMQEGLTFCVDNQKEPISGEILKYQDGVITRRYRMKDGYLDGVGISYDNNGYVTSKLPYSKGKLEGYVINYNREGTIKSKIPYKDGRKEGISEYVGDKTTVKAIYIDDAFNGKAQIWENLKRTKLYDIDMSNGLISKAVYYHLDCKDKTVEVGQDIKKEAVDDIFIDGVNLGCFQMHELFSCNPIPVYIAKNVKNADESCSTWLASNKKDIEVAIASHQYSKKRF